MLHCRRISPDKAGKREPRKNNGFLGNLSKEKETVTTAEAVGGYGADIATHIIKDFSPTFMFPFTYAILLSFFTPLPPLSCNEAIFPIWDS